MPVTFKLTRQQAIEQLTSADTNHIMHMAQNNEMDGIKAEIADGIGGYNAMSPDDLEQEINNLGVTEPEELGIQNYDANEVAEKGFVVEVVD